MDDERRAAGWLAMCRDGRDFRFRDGEDAMNNRYFCRLALFAASLLLPFGASAHHSRVEYTGGEMIEIEGEVVRVVWRNPHIMFTVRSVSADGTTTDWVLEGPGATSVRSEGLVDGYIGVGDQVRGAGQRSDRREAWLRLAHIYASGGPELIFTRAAPRWSDESIGGGHVLEAEAGADRPNGIYRVWVWRGGTPYEIDALPPLTPEAMAAWQAYDPLADDPVLDCTLPGMPRVQTIAGSRPFEITQRGEDIVIRTENYNRTRVIDMGAHADPSTVEPSPLGYSRGRWDGATLVVETSRINYPFFDLPPWWGVPQTEAIELVERFTLEGETLAYDFWAYDPNTFTAPIEKQRFLAWTWEPGLEVGTDNCEIYFEDR